MLMLAQDMVASEISMEEADEIERGGHEIIAVKALEWNGKGRAARVTLMGSGGREEER